eukprot:scaffold4037_cov145-Skeletonema_marinoi.AAC.12
MGLTSTSTSKRSRSRLLNMNAKTSNIWAALLSSAAVWSFGLHAAMKWRFLQLNMLVGQMIPLLGTSINLHGPD